MGYQGGKQTGRTCAHAHNAVYAERTHVVGAHVDAGCEASAGELFTSIAAVAVNLMSKALTLYDRATFPRCSDPSVRLSPAYVILHGKTFYEYKARKLIGKLKGISRLWYKAELSVEAPDEKVAKEALARIEALKKSWKTSIFGNKKRRKTALTRGEMKELFDLCRDEFNQQTCRTFRLNKAPNLYKAARRPAHHARALALVADPAPRLRRWSARCVRVSTKATTRSSLGRGGRGTSTAQPSTHSRERCHSRERARR